MRILRAVHRAARLMDTAERHRQPRGGHRNAPVILDRRSVLAGGGALIVSFSLTALSRRIRSAGAARAKPPGSLKSAVSRFLVRIDADGGITVFTGKVELGHGFETACNRSPRNNSTPPSPR